MREISREWLDFLRDQYPKGSRIQLTEMGSDHHPIPPGSKGILDHIDDLGHFHVRWNNGQILDVVIGEDRFTVLTPESTTLKLYMPLTADLYTRNEYGEMEDDTAMMQEIMDQEERVMLDQIAKLTEENHVEWACDEYNPIGFLDKDDDSEQSACICQMFRFSAVLNGFHYELELAEYINVPSGKIDLSVTLTRNDDEHFLKIDSILSVELATSQEKEAKDIDSIAAVRLAKHLVPLAVKTDAVAEAFSWASFINQTGISKALLNNNLTKLGEKLCSEHRVLDFHYAVFDNAYKDRLLAEL